MKLRLLFLGLFLMVGTMFSFASTSVKVAQPAVTNSAQPAVQINEAARTISIGKPADAKKVQDGSFYFVDCWGRLWYVEYWGFDNLGEVVDIVDAVTCFLL